MNGAQRQPTGDDAPRDDLAASAVGIANRPGFRHAWQHRRWRFLLASMTVSGIGDWLYFTAFAVWLFDETGSPGWLGAVATARMLMYVVFSSPAGSLGQRFNRRRMLLSLDLARAAVMVALAVIFAVDGPPLLAA